MFMQMYIIKYSTCPYYSHSVRLIRNITRYIQDAHNNNFTTKANAIKELRTYQANLK